MGSPRAAGAAVAAVALALAVARAAAFNFAPEHARVLHDPRKDTRSYFGFAVALRKHEAGADSIKISISSCLNSLIEMFLGTFKTSVSDKDNGGLGAVVVTQNSGNAIMTCAPRWKSNEVCDNVQLPSRLNGICYFTSNITYPASRVTPFRPFTKCDGQIFKNKYHFAFAEAGMSVQIVKNLSEIILGAPGISNWRGMILRHRIADNASDIPCPSCYKMQDYSYFGYAVNYGKFSHSEGILYVSGAPRAAENKGKIFIFKFERQWSYNKIRPWGYKIIKEREGTQLGEYFGASLCVADFNKDGLDDLLVGAPQHSVKTNIGDEGCIYVLLSSDNDWKAVRKIAGSDQRGARFGTAIALLGDINSDGFPDVAVGAPYENNRQGAIYIYHGNKNGLNYLYSQKIKPSEKLFLRGFGASISEGLDVDGNYVNDIAVGAYISGHVVLVRTYPVVTIIPDLMPKDRKIPFTTETFEIKLCFSFAEDYKSLRVGVAISLKLDHYYKRISFEAGKANYTSHYNISLQNKQHDCQTLNLFIQNKTEFSKPIEIFVEYKLITPLPLTNSRESKVSKIESDTFCKHCAIINPKEEHWRKWLIQYIPDSAPADLNVKANFLNVKSPYIIGTTNTIEFYVQLKNNKEQAMDTYVFIIFPSVPLSLLKQFPNSCQVNVRELVNDILELVCEVESPFYHGIEHYINITLVMTEVPSELTKLNISVYARSISLEEHEPDNEANLYLSLERSFDLEIHGKSAEYSLIDDELTLNDEGLGEGKATKQQLYKHSYQIINNGPSPATNIDLNFEIPTSMRHHFADPIEVVTIREQVAYLEEQPLSCTVVDSSSSKTYKNFSIHDEIQFPSNRTFILSCSETSVLCTQIICRINSLYPGNRGAKISFALHLMAEKLGAAMGLKDIILIKTFGQILISPKRNLEVQSVVWTKPPTAKLDIITISIGITCGLLIFLTLVLLLIKALESNSIPASTFYSPRGSIMVF
ncbi:Integrin alpha-PS3 [Gryllus bimaculatus]|nr:Integrin alpha-PS3 [Gryllus bimaculatus]